MSVWGDFEVESKITDILREIPHQEEHHFGRPYLSAYQLAIAVDRRWPVVRTALDNPRVVRELRGALRVDERGLIVTTAEFTPEASREAAAEGKAKIGLLGGDALVRLCAERGIGVDRRQVTLLDLSPDALQGLNCQDFDDVGVARRVAVTGRAAGATAEL